MKTTLRLLTFAILIAFCSCRQNSVNEQAVTHAKDNILSKSTKEIPKEERQKQIEEENRADSVRLNKLLKEALLVARKNLQFNNFTKKYEVTPDDSSQNFTIDITIGHLFSLNKKHLLIRRINSSAAYLNLYVIKDSDFKSVIFREQTGMSYIKDTIRDVNGDGLKDFLVHWYPSSGCCRRNVYNVYLYQVANGTFTNDYEFINPTFSPKEKLIRGVKYGHPGEVGIYKYKWNGFQVDTVEFIYPDQSDTLNRYYLRTQKELYSSKNVKSTKLKSVPKEYNKWLGHKTVFKLCPADEVLKVFGFLFTLVRLDMEVLLSGHNINTNRCA